MVAVLQYIPEDDYCHVAPVRAPLSVVPEVTPEPEVRAVREVHRQPSPRVTRSHSAAVYWRRRFVATALGLGVLLTAMHAGAALGGTTTTACQLRDRPTGRHALVDRAPARAGYRHAQGRRLARGRARRLRPHARRSDPVVPLMAAANAPVMRGSVVGVRGVSARAISWGDVASVRSSSGARPLRVRSPRDPRTPCTPTRTADTRRDRDRVAARAR
jgi:hypothetical protein